MNIKVRGLLLLIPLASCAGDSDGRKISGRINLNGEPLSGVSVYTSKNLDDFSKCDGRVLTSTNNQGRFEVSNIALPVRPCFLINKIQYSDLVIMDDGSEDEIKLYCIFPAVVTGHFEDQGACFILNANGS